MNKLSTGSLIASLTLLASIDALACGETLFRVGQGTRYDNYSAPYPAVVLLHSRPGGATAGSEKALSRGLERAGHKVTVMSAGESLPPAAGARPYDVVIADLAAIDGVAQSLGAAAAKPAFVPVLASSDPGEPGDRYRAWVREGASLGKYLHAINKVMEIRAK